MVNNELVKVRKRRFGRVKQFATNAGCKIGSIRRASQGAFQILSIDSNVG